VLIKRSQYIDKGIIGEMQLMLSTPTTICQYIKKHASLLLLLGIAFANASLVPAITIDQASHSVLLEYWRGQQKKDLQSSPVLKLQEKLTYRNYLKRKFLTSSF